MSHKLTKRQLQSWKKANERKEQRLRLKAAQPQHLLERAPRRARPPRRRAWWDDEAVDHNAQAKRRPAPPAAAATVETAREPSPQTVGTVIEVRSADSLVAHGGRVVRAVLPPGSRVVDPVTRSPLAVGDRVQLQPAGVDAARIVAMLPRRSALTRDVYDPSRRDPAHKGQVLAANIDEVVVVCSPAEPPFRPRLIDRYLVAASRDALPAVVCLNKVDLGVPNDVAAWLRGYAGLGVGMVRTSAVSEEGLDDLRTCVTAKVSLFTGHSGVGKSSLLNALEPGLALRVREVTQASAGQGKGRHTTSSARLVPLSLPDTFVVDTPGIRAFGIRGLLPHELAGCFSDLAALAHDCAYRDCLHRGEPGCAVAAQAARERFLGERLASYRAMLGELRR